MHNLTLIYNFIISDLPLEESILLPIITDENVNLVETLEEKLPEVPKSRPIVIGDLSVPVDFDVIKIPVLSEMGSSAPLINDLVDAAVEIVYTTKAVTGTTSASTTGSLKI